MSDPDADQKRAKSTIGRNDSDVDQTKSYREWWIKPASQTLPQNRQHICLDDEQAREYQEEWDGKFGPPKGSVRVVEKAALDAAVKDKVDACAARCGECGNIVLTCYGLIMQDELDAANAEIARLKAADFNEPKARETIEKFWDMPWSRMSSEVKETAYIQLEAMRMYVKGWE